VIGLPAVLAPSPQVKLRRAVFVAHLAAHLAAAVGLAIVAWGCGRTGFDPGGGAASGLGGIVGAGAGAGGGACGGRVPMKHRASGSACPSDRGPGPSFDQCAAVGGAPAGPGCQHDGECSAGGVNGRCLPVSRLFGPCTTGCSYDRCLTDSDCGDRVPCTCRPTVMDPAANVCETASNCAVDGDCGAGGYCSPSLVGQFCFCPAAMGDGCGHGYFCHTPGDKCIDDADCGGGQTCNYALATGTWTCSECWPIP
jgi:hypothetical protein